MRTGIIIFIVISAGIIIYSNGLGGDFIWDDNTFIIHNDFIKDLRLLPKYFGTKYALAHGTLAGDNYRPFLTLSYAIDYYFWKLNPFGYHLSNTLFHITNAILIFYFVLLLTKKISISFLASLFFLAHPIQTESVTWLSGRADVLFLFFYLVALISYIKYIQKKSPFHYLSSVLFFSCSMLSKEMAVSFPFIIILYDFFCARKERITTRVIRYFPYFLMLEGYVLLRFGILGKFAQSGYWTGQVYTTFLSMARGIVHYIRLLIYPVGLCADYLTFPLARSIKEPVTFLSIAIICLILICALRLSRKHRYIAFSIFWFFITLGPAMNIVPIKILIAERFLYIPSIGYCIIMAVLLGFLFEKFEKIYVLRYSIICCSAFIICAYSYLTMTRNTVWLDGVAFFQDIVERYPDNYRAHNNLAGAYFDKGYRDRAYAEAKKALETAPEEFPFTRAILARWYISENRIDDAIEQYKYALKADPLRIAAYRSLGIMYEKQEKYESAINVYKRILALEPNSFEAKISIAMLHSRTDDIDLGIRELEEVLKEPPPPHYRSVYAGALLSLGNLYFDKGDNKMALKSWQTVYEDFKDQLWFNEISKLLIGRMTSGELLQKTRSWQPEFKVLSFYYIGIRKEIEGDGKNAEIYYQKALDIATEKLQPIKELAAKRLEKLKK